MRARCKGHRDYDWAWAATASPRHWVLIRRSIGGHSELAFFYCHAPARRPVSLPVLIAEAGKRWPVEECHQQAKGQAGFDQHQVRLWHSFHRHTVLSMCARTIRVGPRAESTVLGSVRIEVLGGRRPVGGGHPPRLVALRRDRRRLE